MALRRAPGVRALARPERAFCTCVCPSRRVWPLAFARPQGHALPSPARQNPPSLPWRPIAPPSEPLGGTPASSVRLYHGRRRPSHNSSPAALVSRSSLSPSPSASTDPAPAIATSPCRNRISRPAVLSPATAEPTFPCYKWPQASLEHPQASHRVHPLAQILLKTPSSPPPATSAVAVPQLNSP